MRLAAVLPIEARISRRILLKNQLQPVPRQYSLHLDAGMHRPWSGVIQLQIGLPMRERLPRLPLLLISQRQIVVRIRISRS